MPTEFMRLDDLVSDDGHRVPAYLLAPPNARVGADNAHFHSEMRRHPRDSRLWPGNPISGTTTDSVLTHQVW